MKQLLAVSAVALLVFALLPSRAEDTGTPVRVAEPATPGHAGVSLQNEANAAVDRGIKWLLAQQNADGHWSNPDFPALTALPLWALVKGGCTDTGAIGRAVSYILASVHEDGSIWRQPNVAQKGGGLANYNTAICMVALHAVNDPRLTPVVQKARRVLAGTQHLGDDIYKGGMGYDPETGRPYADLSNSSISYEAMRLTQNVEDLRTNGEAHADLDWKAAEQFISHVQNLPESNPTPTASDRPEDRGGFAYRPDASMAGSTTNDEGEVKFRSYGSMTYAGLLSFIYSDVAKDDPRVQSAFDWAVKHWTLDENPGMGNEGLYYFYNVLSKGLAAYGQDALTLPDGKRVNWRDELVRKLVSLQKIDPKTGDGSWMNETGRWWEADPVLVTSYSLLALEIAR